jgi:hypothetical protein
MPAAGTYNIQPETNAVDANGRVISIGTSTNRWYTIRHHCFNESSWWYQGVRKMTLNNTLVLDTILYANAGISIPVNKSLTVDGPTYLLGSVQISASQNLIFSTTSGSYQDVFVHTGTPGESRLYFWGPGGNGNNQVRIYANDYQDMSDRRLKKNIEDLPSSVDVIKSLKPRSFTWKENNRNTVGFIAQEAMKVIDTLRDDAIVKNGDDENPCNEDGTPAYYGIAYNQFIPYMVKCMQEMLVRIETLESQLAASPSPSHKNKE